MRKQYEEDDAPSSPRRRHSSADAYTDDSDSDDLDAKAAAVAKSSKKMADVVGPSELREVMVTRSRLAEFCNAPWFGDWVKGGFQAELVEEGGRRLLI